MEDCAAICARGVCVGVERRRFTHVPDVVSPHSNFATEYRGLINLSRGAGAGGEAGLRLGVQVFDFIHPACLLSSSPTIGRGFETLDFDQ
jgi:hypothetical protein